MNKGLAFSLLFIGLLHIITADSKENSTKKCPKNEELLDSGIDCRKCSNYLFVKCTSNETKCYCKADYVRRDDTNECIPISECPKEQKCGENEVLKDGGFDCQTCSNYQTVRCAYINETRCYCKDGHVRADDTKKCTAIEDCPKKITSCPKNEVLADSGFNCQTCSNYAVVFCVPLKETRCYCNNGFVRHDDTKECIPISECPPKPKVCPNNEILNKCRNHCPPTCADPKKTCNNKSCQQGCDCKPDYIRSVDNGQCIKEDQCPVCAKNEVIVECGNPCQPTCQDPKKQPCPTFACTPGCHCKPGYIRITDNGNCMPANKCPTCGVNEEPVECGNPCQPTCDDPYKAPCPTTACTAGCRCKSGFIRDKNNGKCIPEKECQTCLKKNQEWTSCGSSCPKSCQQSDIVCPAVCIAGCFCKKGYVINNENGECILESECQSCPKKNQEWTTCGSRCPRTCQDDTNDPIACPAICVRGCFCKKGYIINKKNGECVLESECPKPECGKNEKPTDCAACQTTCENYKDSNRICQAMCKIGCMCQDGFARDQSGKCVPVDQCPKKECDKDEIYTDCGVTCARTCGNYRMKRPCPAICEAGCICKDDLVRDENTGKCVPIDKCPKDKPCGKDEVPTECVACSRNCNNYNLKVKCQNLCENGCMCKDDLVRDETTGKCVPIEKCPKKQECGKDEVPTDCSADCQTTCDNYNQTNKICTAICKPGCLCKDGYARDKSGKCIPTDKCPKQECGKDEVHTDCGAACAKTCSDPDLKRPCPKICKPGCICKGDLVRDENSGKCVPVNKCPKDEKCGKDEVHTDCGAACAKTCSDPDLKRPCPKICKPGCICKGDLVRDENSGKCVPVNKCPKDEKCGKDEVHTDCGAACAKTCSDPDLKRPCPKICKPGCICKGDLVRDENSGKCVPVNKCPKDEKCGKDEVHTDCGAACGKTCSDPDLKRPCPKICKPGCICKGDLVRDENSGKCVPVNKCPKDEKCGKDEVHTDCGAACGKTCSDPDLKRPCPKICKPGCICKGDLVRDENSGKCVPVNKCPKDEKCGKDEVHTDCGAACAKTCSDPDLKRPCPKICKPGCICKGDLVRDENSGKCVPVNKCPKDEKCGKDEVHTDCGAACAKTCSDPDLKRPCPKICKPGCICKGDLVRDENSGKCVPVNKCPKDEKCGKDEVHTDCGTACAKTCSDPDLKRPCPKICKPGCICKGDLVRDENSGKCVPVNKCPKDENHKCKCKEQWKDCGSACPNTCSNPNAENGVCKEICVAGCFCKKKYVRDEATGKCVKPKKCSNKKCKKNEVWDKCGTACPNTCANPNAENGPCTDNCVIGCRCKDGLLRDEKTGKCVKPKKCCKTDKCNEDDSD